MCRNNDHAGEADENRGDAGDLDALSSIGIESSTSVNGQTKLIGCASCAGNRE